MTRWRAQAIAALAWLLFAVVASKVVDARAHGFFAMGPSIFWVFFGPVAALIIIVTSVVVLLWRSATGRAVAAVHGVLALAFAIFLRVVT